MTIGVGGYTAEQALATLSDMTDGVNPIQLDEYRARIAKAQSIMQREGIKAIFANAGTNLYYFTGTKWYASERLVGAIIPASGDPTYIAPNFEINTLKGFMQIEGDVKGWHEDESPYDLVIGTLNQMGISNGKFGIDESAAFFIFDGLRQASDQFEYINAKVVTAGCRIQKSAAELALMQRAKDMTLEVHKAAAKILKPGISTQEVTDFIDQAHQKVGAAGSSFCIVLFGVDSSFPHGVKSPKSLEQDDIVLIDTGCLLHGYNSDITRTYVFGAPTSRQRKMWAIEKEAQAQAFAAAQIGVSCGEVDVAARKYLESQGLGPEYAVPGLPHRTGHGIGLDIHEWPYLVRNDATPLAPGMCFSNEPMLVVPDEFGVRLEDHFYMTEDGPKWFTEPSHSIDDPFGYEA
ncbi:MAG: Xaa-Pro peptidase family protein [Kangiellaceae bacterium]|nr:Xaa-Pro peptidase family protein [Kangiellaceae bacterium]MCW9001001.1 Xaa-Pro peptidase family protein [Kangiellaceae bacterium]MCW9018583.1 Xaa-Pro peptidase family protein [Kangiellaceae bacterium]